MLRWLVVILAALQMGGASIARAENRLALVIGNSAYKRAPLRNATSDARLMADKLRALKFEVSSYYDVGQKDMKRAATTFSSRLKESGADTVAFIYYSGHGVQMKGENYLIPIDENITVEGDVDIEAVSTSSLMSILEHAGNRLNIVVLDACRTNPFGYARSGERGLARIDAPSGSLVAFATAPGKSAKDGEGGNSPYTSALAQTLGEPGLPIELAFKKARNIVVATTKGEQTPWESTSLQGEDFYPAGRATGAIAGPATKPEPVPAPAPAAQPTSAAVDQTIRLEPAPAARPTSAAVDQTIRSEPAPADARRITAGEQWAALQRSTNERELQKFLHDYGDTEYGAHARTRLAALSAKMMERISGKWVLRKEGQHGGGVIGAFTIRASGEKIAAHGDGWSGQGAFNGRKGFYDWRFTDGKTGRTTIWIDDAEQLHGRVRGGGIDWDYVGSRR
jgi:uncharacterized caspase-like protein